MTFIAILAALRERWRWVAVCVAVGLALGFAATLLTPPKYQATVSLYISAQYPGDNASAAYQGSLLTTQRMSSYTELLTDDQVTSDVVARLGLPQSPSQLASQMTASAESDSVLLRLEVTDRNPAAAAAIANTAADSFSRLVAQLERPLDQNRPPLVVARLVRPAAAPLPQVSPQRSLDLAVAGALGLLIGVGAAVIRQLTDTSIKSAEDVDAASGAPSLGTLPLDDELSRSASMFSSTAGSPVAEAVRLVRTNLQFTDVDSHSKIVLVTSCAPGDGKSTTAANLAHALAIGGLRTALVEVDLRRPSLAEYLGVEGSVGLTTVLSGRTGVDDVLQSVSGSPLVVLTSGRIPPNPSELLGSANMQDLLGQMRQQYDYVILDAPPVLAVSDAAALASTIDSAVLVCRYATTKAPAVEQAAGALRQVGVKISGTVLNAVPQKVVPYRYAYQSKQSTASERAGTRSSRFAPVSPAVGNPVASGTDRSASSHRAPAPRGGSAARSASSTSRGRAVNIDDAVTSRIPTRTEPRSTNGTGERHRR